MALYCSECGFPLREPPSIAELQAQETSNPGTMPAPNKRTNRSFKRCAKCDLKSYILLNHSNDSNRATRTLADMRVLATAGLERSQSIWYMARALADEQNRLKEAIEDRQARGPPNSRWWDELTRDVVQSAMRMLATIRIELSMLTFELLIQQAHGMSRRNHNAAPFLAIWGHELLPGHLTMWPNEGKGEKWDVDG